MENYSLLQKLCNNFAQLLQVQHLVGKDALKTLQSVSMGKPQMSQPEGKRFFNEDFSLPLSSKY